MGVEPPFIYDRPTTYSFAGTTQHAFDPRAATRASWSPPARSQPKKDGPLLEFNRHPDSYLIVPYGNLNVRPMSPRTRNRVVRARRTQLALRLLELVGALGLLFCVICINKISGSAGWILRVAPAVAVLHTLYGVYHLVRDVQGRTPASTASYMLFATTVDAGLIPFLVFSALISHSDYTSNTYGWGTLFNGSDIAYKIIYSFFLTSVTTASLLLVSLVLGIYLATLFRKIAKLPPDMNPLEPILTARPHHKRNKSEMVDKLSPKKSPNRMSDQTDPGVAGTRRVPFLHTRTDSADSITLYGNNSARNSKTALLQKEEHEYRRSQLSLVDGVSRPTSTINPAATSRPAGSGIQPDNARSALEEHERQQKTSSWLSYMKSSDFEGACRNVSGYSAVQLNEQVPQPEPVSQYQPSLSTVAETKSVESKNWYERPTQNRYDNFRDETGTSPPQPPSFLEDKMSLDVPVPTQHKKRSREPLGMNPPTPRVSESAQDQAGYVYSSCPVSPQRNVLQDRDANAVDRPSLGSRPSSFVGSGGKSRYYGNLRRSISSLSPHDDENVQVYGNTDEVSDLEEESGQYPERMLSKSSHIEIYHVDDDDEEDQQPRSYEERQQQFQSQWNGPRQVSNSTGYDLHSGYAGLGAEFGQGMGRRREVSGKVAEEGRGGGYGGVGQSEQEVVGFETGQAKRGGAAGWARFKGL